MARPAIITVDDDPMVSAAITRDLRGRYGADYRVVRTGSGEQALSVIRELALKGQQVALIASDQRMPGMTGIDLLQHGSHLFELYKRSDFSVDGRGIGLFIVKMQVAALGGTISVKSRPNKGTCFYIDLPFLNSHVSKRKIVRVLNNKL